MDSVNKSPTTSSMQEGSISLLVFPFSCFWNLTWASHYRLRTNEIPGLVYIDRLNGFWFNGCKNVELIWDTTHVSSFTMKRCGWMRHHQRYQGPCQRHAKWFVLLVNHLNCSILILEDLHVSIEVLHKSKFEQVQESLSTSDEFSGQQLTEKKISRWY